MTAIVCTTRSFRQALQRKRRAGDDGNAGGPLSSVDRAVRSLVCGRERC